MTLTLGFSAWAMILVAFVELLQKGIKAIGMGPAHLAFFGGMVVIFLIDALIPHHYMAEHHETGDTGLLVALGIGIHNFPEGRLFRWRAGKPPVGYGHCFCRGCAQHPGRTGRLSTNLRSHRQPGQGFLEKRHWGQIFT